MSLEVATTFLIDCSYKIRDVHRLTKEKGKKGATAGETPILSTHV
jgi:hypothetical protein